MRKFFWVCIVTIAFLAPLVSLAQSSVNLRELCSNKNLGSAIGNGECYAARLKQLESTWQQVINSSKKRLKTKIDAPNNIEELVDTEAKSWRQYIKDKCELETAGTAGMVQWDYVYAMQCEYAALQKRIAEEKKSKSP